MRRIRRSRHTSALVGIRPAIRRLPTDRDHERGGGGAVSRHTQIRTFRDTEADMVAALTLTNVPEAVGIARAARSAGLPVAISFTVETGGRLPTATTLREAIEQVDEPAGDAPAY